MDNRWAFDDREVAENEMRMETGEGRGRGAHKAENALFVAFCICPILW